MRDSLETMMITLAFTLDASQHAMFRALCADMRSATPEDVRHALQRVEAVLARPTDEPVWEPIHPSPVITPRDERVIRYVVPFKELWAHSQLQRRLWLEANGLRWSESPRSHARPILDSDDILIAKQLPLTPTSQVVVDIGIMDDHLSDADATAMWLNVNIPIVSLSMPDTCIACGRCSENKRLVLSVEPTIITRTPTAWIIEAWEEPVLSCQTWQDVYAIMARRLRPIVPPNPQ